MPAGHFCAGDGPVGVGLGMDLHLPPMNLRPPVQKQFGGLPTRPPEHLPVDVDGVGVGFELGDAFCSHCPDRVACVPGGHGGLVPCVPPVPGPPLVSSDTQAPRGCFAVRAKCVPDGHLGPESLPPPGLVPCVPPSPGPPLVSSTTQAPRGCFAVRAKCVPDGHWGPSSLPPPGLVPCVPPSPGPPFLSSITQAPRGCFAVRAKCVPDGHWGPDSLPPPGLVPCVPPSPGPPFLSSITQAPRGCFAVRAKCVPDGHWGPEPLPPPGSVPCVPPSPGPPRLQTPSAKCVPTGQQFGAAPTGRSPGHGSVPGCGGVEVEVVPRGAHLRPVHRWPGGQAHCPDRVATMPRKQVTADLEWNFCVVHAGGFWTFWASRLSLFPPIEFPLASKPRYLHTQRVSYLSFIGLQSLSTGDIWRGRSRAANWISTRSA